MEKYKQKRNHKTFLVEMLPKHSIGAEIGVWTGKFTDQIISITQPKKYHLIDPWKFMPQYYDRWYGGSRAKSQQDMDEIFNIIDNKFGSMSCVEIHRMTSARAAINFKSKYFDWVYIDGDHSYKEVKWDISKYYPLVKSGGFLCGDDWQLRSVKRAVVEILNKNNKIHSHTYQWWIKK